MEALLIAFVAAALAEWGDKPQLITAAAAARMPRPGSLLGAMALASVASASVAAFVGVLLRGIVTLRAIALLLAVALVFAGVVGLIRQRAANPGARGLAVASAELLVASLGGKAALLTGVLAAYYGSPTLTAAGAATGMFAANVPAALLGGRFGAVVPVDAIRWIIASLFLIAGFVVAINALRLI